MLTIEMLKETELVQVHQLISITCNISWRDYYPQKSIDYVIDLLNVKTLSKKFLVAHFYCVKELGKIIGCGAIEANKNESVLSVIFVHPDYQRFGVGRKIIQTLEKDSYGLQSNRIEVNASFFAVPFYKKMGYEHKNGELVYNDGCFVMEKIKLDFDFKRSLLLS